MNNICIIGGGTAGWMAAAYLKSRFADSVNIKIIYDHSNPVIGVGESTTPTFINFLNMIGIDYKELIKNINSTIKLGIKFTNWNGDNKRYYHSFNLFEQIPSFIVDANLIAAYEILNGYDTGAETYNSANCDKMQIPVDGINPAGSFALHIDGTLFSQFLKERFEDKIEVIDDVIQDIDVDNNNITKIICKNNIIESNFFIDASGLQSLCMKKLQNSYIDKSDYLYMDSSIPVQIQYNEEIPPYTEALATSNGWIWKTPLSNRLGLGYVYSSKFTSDEDAKEDFKKHILETYKVKIKDFNRILRFTPGYWKEQWKGNCICIGLSSGFLEPLESTNIHMIINQLRLFSDLLDPKVNQWTIKNYNKFIVNMYEQAFDFIRLHYNTKRTDSNFWRAVNNNKPDWLTNYEGKCKSGMITSLDVYNDWDRKISNKIFGLTAYTRVSYGLGLFDPQAIKEWLELHNFLLIAKESFENTNNLKSENYLKYVTHKEFLNNTI